MGMFSKPVEKTFEVTDAVHGDWTITIAQATEAVYEALSDVEGTVRYTYGEQNQFKGMERDRNLRKRAKVLAYHVIVNTTGFIDDAKVEQFKSSTGQDGYLRLKNAMDWNEFNAKWQLLPAAIADKIAEFIYEVNPTLAPNG